MDNRAIGVFDSGLGGLTALKALSELLPGEDIVFFGDRGHMPYGDHSREEIITLAVNGVELLTQRGMKAVLIACGTMSCNAMEALRDRFDLPILGVLEPAAAAAAAATARGPIGVIATEATVRSGAYARRLEALRPDTQILSLACPKFVPMIESGHSSVADPLVRTTVAETLEPLRRAGVDTLLLGCTHYPLLQRAIADFLGSGVRQISSGAEAAKALAEALTRENRLAGRERGRREFLVSGDAAGFAELGRAFLGGDLGGDVTQIAACPL